jgi:hypothetical protein
MLKLILSPLNKILAIIALVFAAVLAIYSKGKTDASARMVATQEKDAMRRLKNVLKANDDFERNNAPSKLRNNDGNRRD